MLLNPHTIYGHDVNVLIWHEMMYSRGLDAQYQEKQPLVSAQPPLDPSAHQTAAK